MYFVMLGFLLVRRELDIFCESELGKHIMEMSLSKNGHIEKFESVTFLLVSFWCVQLYWDWSLGFAKYGF